ncbi:hypothetical protein [Ponticaulis profundi]|uniref:Uncharacterized protein n=1 Tax=Ponticaulis profundi TaxID=2665222 RepID=A0ABW1S9X6_9PROT
MQDAPAHPQDEFPDYQARVNRHIFRAERFPHQWAIGGDAPETYKDIPCRLFRYDVQRLTVMVERVEHMIRCMIIWLAFRLMRDGQVTAGKAVCPPEPGLRLHLPQPDIHPLFAVRGLPLYPTRLPAFRISMADETPSDAPDEETCDHSLDQALAQHRVSEGYQRRPRHDDELACERLIDRLLRLADLHESMEARARRYARYWLGRFEAARLERAKAALTEPCTLPQPPHLKGGGPPLPRFLPLKIPLPPDKWLSDTLPDEADDLTALHDVAIRAAELFEERCG